MAIITNKLGLPQAYVDLCKGDGREVDWNKYSVTELLRPTRDIILSRRHGDEIETDCSEMTNLVFGTAVHNLLEKYDKTGKAELSLRYPVRSKVVSGRIDLYDPATYTVVDWKTATVTKVLTQDFKDYDKQGSTYAVLAVKSGYMVVKYVFILMLKDWSARALRMARMKGDAYPESAIYVYEKTITPQDLTDTEWWLNDKIADLEEAEKMADDDLADCGEVDTWYTGNKYAVYKKEGAARADRVFDTEKEALDYIEAKGGFLVYRKGEYRKCQDYCSCCKFCKYYDERKAE